MGIDQIMDLVDLKLLMDTKAYTSWTVVSFLFHKHLPNEETLTINSEEGKLERLSLSNGNTFFFPHQETSKKNKGRFWKMLLGFQLRKKK